MKRLLKRLAEALRKRCGVNRSPALRIIAFHDPIDRNPHHDQPGQDPLPERPNESRPN